MNTQSVILSTFQSVYNRWLFTAALFSVVAGAIHTY